MVKKMLVESAVVLLFFGGVFGIYAVEKNMHTHEKSIDQDTNIDGEKETEISILFDRMAAYSSWFKKSLDASMAAWGAMRDGMRDDVSIHERELCTDVIMGRLAYAHFCLERITHQNTNIEHSQNKNNEQDSGPLYQDLHYLARITDTMKQELIEYADYFDADRAACIRNSLDNFSVNIQKSIANVLLID